MERDTFLDLARQIMALPTAPYHEHFVGAAVSEFAGQRPGLDLAGDDFGNLLLLYDGCREAEGDAGGEKKRKKKKGTRLIVTAHMDHPGMAFAERLSGRDFLFEKLGGVPVDMSRDSPVAVYRLDRDPDQSPIRGRITAYVAAAADKGAAAFKVRVEPADADDVGPGSFAMLDLPALEVRKRRLRARACDDLAGVAVGLSFLDGIASRKSPVRAGLLLTRAEETGFGGMLAAARSGQLDRHAVYVNIECSSSRAGARLGRGPVIRVGDRASVFDPNITGGLAAAAEELARAAGEEGHPFCYQRKLMDSGTCEATALTCAGYKTGAVALPLKNYHNRGKNGLRPEIIDIDDALWLVEFLVDLALRPDGISGAFKAAARDLDRKMTSRHREHVRRLRHQPLRLAPVPGETVDAGTSTSLTPSGQTGD